MVCPIAKLFENLYLTPLPLWCEKIDLELLYHFTTLTENVPTKISTQEKCAFCEEPDKIFLFVAFSPVTAASSEGRAAPPRAQRGQH